MPTEIGVLNRVTVGDTYTDAATLIAPVTRGFTIFVYNNSILYELALDTKGTQWSPYESELSPGYFSIARPCSGIRFRNFVTAQAGIVSVKALR